MYMYIRHDLGQTGEDVAEIYLLEKGYKILDRHFICRQGEIDIIAKDKKEIVFIEVKTRSNRKYGNPADSITYYKQKHLLGSIKYYVYLNKLENSFIRIDVIEVYKLFEGFKVNHIKDVICR